MRRAVVRQAAQRTSAKGTCYAEMLAAVTGEPMSEKFGIILGRKDRVEFRVEDFIHYYRCIKRSFLTMQEGYTGDMARLTFVLALPVIKRRFCAGGYPAPSGAL